MRWTVKLLSLGAALPSAAFPQSNTNEILAIAKVTGACGIAALQREFQKTTKMPGGDQFLTRFWTMEAARLGVSVPQYFQQCNEAIKIYDELFAAGEKR